MIEAIESLGTRRNTTVRTVALALGRDAAAYRFNEQPVVDADQEVGVVGVRAD